MVGGGDGNSQGSDSGEDHLHKEKTPLTPGTCSQNNPTMRTKKRQTTQIDLREPRDITSPHRGKAFFLQNFFSCFFPLQKTWQTMKPKLTYGYKEVARKPPCFLMSHPRPHLERRLERPNELKASTFVFANKSPLLKKKTALLYLSNKS